MAMIMQPMAAAWGKKIIICGGVASYNGMAIGSYNDRWKWRKA